MTKFVVDESNAQRLSTVHQMVELLDASGKVLGYFLPSTSVDKAEYESAASQWSDEELDRRAREPGGKTTAEILEKLSGL